MTDPLADPFRSLHEPVRPVDPDPAFAAALRARLERAVLRPDIETEQTMTTTVETTTHATTVPARLQTMTPYLAVTDARAAVEFYVAAFGATRRGDPIVMPDGRVGHVEVAIGDSVLMLADEYPELGLIAPAGRGGPTGSVRLAVGDPDAVVAAAVAAGATLNSPVADSPYGRGGTVVDPAGHRWMVSRSAPAVRAGDLTYTSLWTADVDRAARFFGAVLGWEFDSDHDGLGRQVTSLTGHIGLWPTTATPTAYCCYAVEDAAAAAAVVRAAGGTAEEPTGGPYGRLVNCVDDQGIPFSLHEGIGATPDPVEPGALQYYEVQAPDLARVRAFYGSVLGLRYLPAADAGYWHPWRDGAPVRPFSGLARGPAPRVVPTFAVRDLDAALVAVMAAGGRPGEVTDTRGTSARCTDDQGMEFGLQEL